MTEIDVYPTPTRLNLARAIDAGKVRWHAWTTPEARWREYELDAVGRKVTSEVRFLAQAGAAWVDFDAPIATDTYLVALTEAGKVWLAQSGGESS